MNWNKGSTGMKMESYIGRLMDLFPNSYINSLNELILYSNTNLYFGLDDVNSEQDIKCKLLEWCSRDAYKTQPFNNHEQNLYYQEMIRKRIKPREQRPLVPYIAISSAIYLVILHQMSYNIMVYI